MLQTGNATQRFTCKDAWITQSHRQTLLMPALKLGLLREGNASPSRLMVDSYFLVQEAEQMRLFSHFQTGELT